MQPVELGRVVNVKGEGDVFVTEEGRHYSDFCPWHGRRVLVVDLGPQYPPPIFVSGRADDGDA